jgi:hypothetical protein
MYVSRRAFETVRYRYRANHGSVLGEQKIQLQT